MMTAILNIGTSTHSNYVDHLAGSGHSVTDVRSLREALALLAAGELPEVIIINTAFNPEVAEFMQMLRGDSALDRTQIIFIGASSDERDMAFTLGANHFLYRPLKIDHLLDVVQ